MKKFTKISLILAGIIGGLGILLCGIAAAFGMNSTMDGVKQALEETGVYDEQDGFHTGYTDSWLGNLLIKYSGFLKESRGEESASAEFAAAQVRHLTLDASMAGITVKASEQTDKITVSMEYGYQKYFSCGLEDDTLTVAYNTTGKIQVEEGPTIVINIPKQTKLEDAVITSDMGNITIEQDALACGALSLSSDMGNITVKGAAPKNLSISCDMGNITFYGTVSETLVAQTDMGNIQLYMQDDYANYNYYASCDMGSMKINGKNYSGLEGEISLENEGANASMQLECSMGTITVEY